jgi:transposase
MLYAGLDLSRKRLDVHLLDEAGVTVEVTTAPPDADGLGRLAASVQHLGERVRAAIESMNGARFVHDQLERAGWQFGEGNMATLFPTPLTRERGAFRLVSACAV